LNVLGDVKKYSSGEQLFQGGIRVSAKTQLIIVITPKECPWHDPAVAGEAISASKDLPRDGYSRITGKRLPACADARQAGRTPDLCQEFAMAGFLYLCRHG
jgi:hypothetical protein